MEEMQVVQIHHCIACWRVSNSVSGYCPMALCRRWGQTVRRYQWDCPVSVFRGGGLAVPTSNFFRGLLHFWGIQLHHLTPNSILHIAIFTHLCQAFLGIKSYFKFFHHFFLVRPQPNANKVAEVGSAEVLLCSEKEDKYIFYRPACRGTEWKSAWFYVGNHQPSLPERIPGPHKVCREWSDSGLGGEQVDKLLGDIATLKDSGVTSGSVVYSCMNRRVKPLQKWENPGFLYQLSRTFRPITFFC